MGIGEGDGEVDIEPYDEFEEQEIQSGPFCRHFADPSDCDLECVRCGHECHEHDQDGPNNGKCNHTGNETGEDCICEDYQDKESN